LDLAHEETPSAVSGGKTSTDSICTGPRSKQEKQKQDKQENIEK
jgi:hypothetical protein